MKRLLTKLIPGLLLFCLLSGSASAQVRIATVDLSKVFTNYWKFKQANAALEDMKADMTKTDKSLVDTLNKEKDNYQKLLADANNQMLSAEQRDKNKKAAEDKLKDARDAEDAVRQYRQQAASRLSEQTSRLRDNLLTEIRAAVVTKAKAGGYTFVFDSAGQTGDRTPFLLYSAGEDITDALLTQLNAGAPVETVDDVKKPDAKDTKKPDEKKK